MSMFYVVELGSHWCYISPIKFLYKLNKFKFYFLDSSKTHYNNICSTIHEHWNTCFFFCSIYQTLSRRDWFRQFFYQNTEKLQIKKVENCKKLSTISLVNSWKVTHVIGLRD